MWFSRREKKADPVPQENLNIQKIPDIFYGGNDPIIYHGIEGVAGQTDNISKKISSSVATRQKDIFVPWWKKKIVMYGSGGLVFVAAVAGISWYYLQDVVQRPGEGRPSQDMTSRNTENNSDNVTTSTSIIETNATSTPTSTLEVVPTSTVSLGPAPLVFPTILLLNTDDADADQLTDIEEELFNTDSGTWDTDSDGYYDGQEVFNLYNPKGFAPVKIIDSGIVREYVNPNWNYRVYYPVGWQLGAVDPENTQLLFNSIYGDYVEVRAVRKDSNQNFISWFSTYAQGQFYADLSTISNRFKIPGMKRKDDLVVYFEEGENIYILIYHPVDSGPVRFRHAFQMMYQSFRPSKVNYDIPTQPVLPGVVSSTEEPAAPVEFNNPLSTSSFSNE